MPIFRRKAGFWTWFRRIILAAVVLTVLAQLFASTPQTPDIAGFDSTAFQRRTEAFAAPSNVPEKLTSKAEENGLSTAYYHPTCPPHPHVESTTIPYNFIPHQMRKEARIVCQGKTSSIKVYPGYVVEITNVILDFSKRFVAGGYSQQGMGFMLVDCQFDSSTEWMQNPLTRSLQTLSSAHFEAKERHEELKHPVVTISRDDCGNVWHAMADFLQPFVSGYVAGVAPQDRHVMVLDDRLMISDDQDDVEVCPYHGALDALGRKGVLRGKLYGDKSVFVPKLIVPVDATHILNIIWRMLPCDAPTIIGQYVDNLFDHFKLPPLSQLVHNRFAQQQTKDPVIKITFSSRRKKPFAPANQPIGRVIKNEEYLLNALREIPSVKLTAVEFYELSFERQLKLFQETDILIGMHGAGLANLVYTPLDAWVIELIPFTWESSEYSSLSAITGRQYLKWRNPKRENHYEIGGCADFENKLTIEGSNVCRTGASETTADIEAIHELALHAVLSLRQTRKLPDIFS